MAIKHLKPKTRKEIAFAKANMSKEEKIAEFLEKYFWSSAMEIYLPYEQKETFYDLVTKQKYKVKIKNFVVEGFYDERLDEYMEKYQKYIQSWIDKGWEEFWHEDNMGQHEFILVKPPIVKENNSNEMIVKEDAMGGVSAPMSTPMNTPGMGNVTPAGIGKIGSGDNFGAINKKPYEQSKVSTAKKKRKKKKLEEENLNPYDKIGTMMAKKAKVPMTFKKKKSKNNQNAMVQKKFEHQIISFDEFKKLSE